MNEEPGQARQHFERVTNDDPLWNFVPEWARYLLNEP